MTTTGTTLTVGLTATERRLRSLGLGERYLADKRARLTPATLTFRAARVRAQAAELTPVTPTPDEQEDHR